ncbi:MAG: tRNA threonylcarbamoyladenosine dehydratase [Bacillota bacterium]
MNEIFSRSARLLGANALEMLAKAHVAVFGIGGVGSYAAEALARSGVGTLTLVDRDKVTPSNCNRQLVALSSTIGRKKAEIMAERICDINPSARVFTHAAFYDAATADTFDLKQYDYIVDAIDTVASKLLLVERAFAAGVPIVSSMGAGNKLDPTRFEVADIYSTSVCPLAKVIRSELRRRGIPALRVVYSKEPPLTPIDDGEKPEASRRQTPGSVAFVPPAAGLILAGEVVRALCGKDIEA